MGQSSSEPLIRDGKHECAWRGVNLRVQETWSEKTRIMRKGVVQTGGPLSTVGAVEGSGLSPFPLSLPHLLKAGKPELFPFILIFLLGKEILEQERLVRDLSSSSTMYWRQGVAQESCGASVGILETCTETKACVAGGGASAGGESGRGRALSVVEKGNSQSWGAHESEDAPACKAGD